MRPPYPLAVSEGEVVGIQPGRTGGAGGPRRTPLLVRQQGQVVRPQEVVAGLLPPLAIGV